ncbi:MAG: tetraacyldisaccharide 4'-kinase [Rhodospirillales bacterium]|nr:tetraacyldisaccharide 4'-kinase [Rhodospirillales bacterium]MBO6788553.1 tetraacyldisaccharide 4'-kinase [Rhodospirillales bacterium]
MNAPEFWGPGRRAILDRLITSALAPLGWIYGTVTASRAGKAATWQAPVPVICVGNVVAGGAGKTQVCLDLVKRLTAAGKAPHVLTRGYGGALTGTVRVDPEKHTAKDVGDEALLLAAHAPVWRSADRVAGAKAACDAGAGVIVMDDGFQNPTLAKALSVLVVDGAYGFGNGHPMPAGPLREPVQGALKRADALVVIGEGDVETGSSSLPRFRAAIRPASDAPDLAGKPVVAFAGIGQPAKFFETLRAQGADLVRTEAFPDHHPFTAGDIEPLIADAKARHATLVTTAKDAVRIPEEMRADVTSYPVALTWDDAGAWQAFILKQSGLN